MLTSAEKKDKTYFHIPDAVHTKDEISKFGLRIIKNGIYYNHTFDDVVQNYYKYIDWLITLKETADSDDESVKAILTKLGDDVDALIAYYLWILNTNGERYFKEHPSQDPYNIELKEDETKILCENENDIFKLLSFGTLHNILILSDPLKQQYILKQLRSVTTLNKLQHMHFTYHKLISWLRKRLIQDYRILLCLKRKPNKIIYEMLCINVKFRNFYNDHKDEKVFPIVRHVPGAHYSDSPPSAQLEFESFVNDFNSLLHFHNRINESIFVEYLDNFAIDEKYLMNEIEYYRKNGIACEPSYQEQHYKSNLIRMSEDEQLYIWKTPYKHSYQYQKDFPKIFLSMRHNQIFQEYNNTRKYLLSLYRKNAHKNLSLYEMGVIKFTKDPGMYSSACLEDY